MLSDAQIRAGIEKNRQTLNEALYRQLYIIYKRLVPTGNTLRYIVGIPQSAKTYHLEYLNIGIPSNANLDNLFFVAYTDSGNLKYVSENLRRNRLGAKLNLFTTPGADQDVPVAGDQTQDAGMLSIDVTLTGTEQLIFDFRGAGLSGLEYVDVMAYGHQTNRVNPNGGYSGRL